MSLTDTQRATLRLFCDTIVPRIDRQPDPLGHWARTATDIGVDQGVEQLIGELDEELRTGLALDTRDDRVAEQPERCALRVGQAHPFSLLSGCSRVLSHP